MEVQMSRLDKLQKRAVRIITCSKYNSYTEPLCRKLNLLKINDLLVISEDSWSIGWKNLQLSLLLSHVWSAIITDM